MNNHPIITEKRLKDLQAGDVIVNVDAPHLPNRTVKRVDQARAPGYVVVQFDNVPVGGTARTSAHGSNVVHVLVKP